MEANVNLRGWVGNAVELRETSKGPVLRLRVATTARYQRDGQWVDGETTWWNVTAWRTLARNVASSVRKGDPVIIAGRLKADTWTDNGVVREDKYIEATTIGHDLTRGEASFRRVARLEDRPEQAEVAAHLSEEGIDDAEVDPETGEIRVTEAVG